jgi:hypothetical protein
MECLCQMHTPGDRETSGRASLAAGREKILAREVEKEKDGTHISEAIELSVITWPALHKTIKINSSAWIMDDQWRRTQVPPTPFAACLPCPSMHVCMFPAGPL